MEIILFNGLHFMLDMIFLTLLLIAQYYQGKNLKNKTKLLDNAIKQLVFYCLLVVIVILLPAIVIAWIDMLGILIMFSALIVGFAILNHSELWYRSNMESMGEHTVKLKFLNKKSETEITNLYERYTHESQPIEEILANNFEIVQKLSQTDLFESMKEKYKMLHPEKKLVEKGKTDEEIIREIFGTIYEGFYYHQVFFYFGFLDETELNYDIQALILSLNEKLPRDFSLTCCLLEDENVDGKNFTTIHGLEGIIDEKIAKRMEVYANDFEFFKVWPTIFDVQKIVRQRDYYQAELESLESDFYELIGNKLSMATRTERIKKYKLRKKETIDE